MAKSRRTWRFCLCIIPCLGMVYCLRAVTKAPVTQNTPVQHVSKLEPLDRMQLKQMRYDRYQELSWYLSTESSENPRDILSKQMANTRGKVTYEVNPVLRRLEVLHLLLDGKYEDYLIFIAMHGKESHISWQEFHNLQRFASSLLQHYPSANTTEVQEVLEIALILLEVGKTQTAKELSWIYNIAYDEDAQLLLLALQRKPEMFPSVARLNPEQKRLLTTILSFHQFDRLWRLEGAEEILDQLKQSNLYKGNLGELELALLLHRCYFMATYPCTDKTFYHMDIMRQACHLLRDQTPTRVFTYYLDRRGSAMGLDPESHLDLAVLRIMAMLDLGSREDAKLVKKVLLQCPCKDMAQIAQELQFSSDVHLLSNARGVSLFLSHLYWDQLSDRAATERIAQTIHKGLLPLAITLHSFKKQKAKDTSGQSICLDFRPLVEALRKDPALMQQGHIQIQPSGLAQFTH